MKCSVHIISSDAKTIDPQLKLSSGKERAPKTFNLTKFPLLSKNDWISVIPMFFFCGVNKLNCLCFKQFVVLWRFSVCFLSQITFRRILFLFGFKNHFNIITPADNLRAKRPDHRATVLHLFNCYVKISPDAVDSSGIIRHLSEAPHQTPWGRLANLISPVCFSNCILLHLGRQKQMHQVIWVQTPLQRIHAVSAPLTSSVYLVLPDALILPAAPKGPLSREKVSTPFSAKAQH